jgi:hypothetical protein
MRSFFPPHIILRVSKQRDLKNEFYQTVGDAQKLFALFLRACDLMVTALF